MVEHWENFNELQRLRIGNTAQFSLTLGKF
jgi:hypothetical protein